jgi:hypothetical protein
LFNFVRVEIPVKFFLLRHVQHALRLGAAVQRPVGGGTLIIALLRDALSKSPKIDDVAHRNYRLSKVQPPYYGYARRAFPVRRGVKSNAKVFLAPAQYTLR